MGCHTKIKDPTSAPANGLQLEFEWQKVSSSLQDSSQYSDRSQKCYRLDGLHTSASFPVLQPPIIIIIIIIIILLLLEFSH